jgi:MSHA biogenesis protein MshN
MSVINKMLRDLDRPDMNGPELAGGGPSGSSKSLSGWMSGTSSVIAPAAIRLSSNKKALWFVSTLSAMGLASMPWWPEPFSLSLASATSVSAAAVMIAPAQTRPEVMAPMPITSPSLLPEAVAGSPGPDALALPVLLTMAEQIDHVPMMRPALPIASKRAPLLSPESAKVPVSIPVPNHVETRSEESHKLASAPSPVPSATLPANEARVAPVRREASGLELTGQAQRLWSSGSHDAAIELLRDALAVVERAAGSDVMRAPPGELIPLVRELARMELAEGQTRQVLDMLKRLEPALAGQADLWAVRANAAQRLGSHQEAIQAYQTALTLRSGESRWMLGTAVSLAARGQTAAALELAEKARATGTISSDVVAYLRQLGVPLKD